MRKIEKEMNNAVKNKIAWSKGNTVTTWQSNTTKSRLNALCYELATGFSVFQKNWNWFVSDFQSKTVKDFTDGITVNYNGCF